MRQMGLEDTKIMTAHGMRLMENMKWASIM